ncbi:hypothetical protein LSAT2_002929 [Lamellibrachia satsuma]|nr:hypothetical protein LSAT2_002929 [Lamellibrachia satsuma]
MDNLVRLTRVGQVLLVSTIGCILIWSTDHVFAEKAPVYADVFKYHWKAPPGETYTCPMGWKVRGVKCYKVYTEPLSWLDAKVVCWNGNMLSDATVGEFDVSCGSAEMVSGATGGEFGSSEKNYSSC